MNVKPSKILVCVGTSSELIKCAPVIKSLEERGVELVVVNLGRNAGLRLSLLEQLDVGIDYHLETARFGPSVDVLDGRLLDRLSAVLESENPDLVLVQGDTDSAALASVAAGDRGIPVGHMDAAQHAGNLPRKLPAEMHRRKIGRGAGHHFVVTESDRRTLLGEGRAGLTALVVAAEGHNDMAVAAAIGDVNKRLSVTERIRKHAIVPAFTLEGGTLTATQKIKRHIVMEKHKTVLAGIAG